MISCTQTQSINLQPTSTSLCQPEKSSFKRHTIRPEWPPISIKNVATHCIKEKSMDQKVLLHNPVVPVGKSHKFFSPWKGPYVILQCLNDVTYRIQEIARQKELIVHYDRLKPFHEPPPTSNVPTRDRRNPKNVSPPSPRQHEQILPGFDHDQCTWHYPYHTVPSATN